MSSATKAKAWHPEDIKAEVRKRRGTLTRIARDNGLSDAACRVAFFKPVPAANLAIALFIGKPVDELWPDWFDAEGNRRKAPISCNENNAKGRRGHRQKQAAK